MNKYQMAHIGGELVVISGVTFYFNKKITETNEKIAELQEENEELRSIVSELQSQVNQLGKFCYMLQNGVGMNEPVSTNEGVKTVKNEVHETPRRKTKPTNSRKEKRPSKKVVSSSDEDSGMETFDDRDLDAELEDELQELNNTTCSNGTCTLLDE